MEKYLIFDPENAKKYRAGVDISDIHFERISDDRAMLTWLVRETRVPIPEEGIGTVDWVLRVQKVFDQHMPGWLMLISS